MKLDQSRCTCSTCSTPGARACVCARACRGGGGGGGAQGDSTKAHLPAGIEALPTQMRPFMKVPVVSTAARHANRMPKKVRMPVTSSLGPRSSPVAMPSRMLRFGSDSRTPRITRLYSSLSVCARNAHTAGPCTVGVHQLKASVVRKML